MSGSDVASMTTRATLEPSGDAYRLKGTKAWISHAGHADFYTSFVRTSDDGSRGLSCFVVPADADGHRVRARPSARWACLRHGARRCIFDGAPVDADRLVGDEGQGMAIALSALDSGRLGIAAAATGLAQAALDRGRPHTPRSAQQFGRPIGDFQGLAFMLADMEAAVTSRPGDLPARRAPAATPAGRSPRQAAVAKLVCTDTAMRVTTDAVQVLGGAGYTQDFPARAVHARGEGDPDLRGHQPDPAPGHLAPRSLNEPR